MAVVKAWLNLVKERLKPANQNDNGVFLAL